MPRRLVLAFPLLILLLLTACVPRAGVPPPASPTPLLPAPAPPGNPPVVSGQFDIRNTSTDMPEVMVQTMEMVFEFRAGPADPWQTLAAACDFTPAAPVLVRETQQVRYDCRFARAIPPGAQLRATAEIRLFGSDQVFRQQVEQ